MAASLELAITAIRSGRKEEGRQLLNLLIQQNPNDEMAWLWMSSVVNTDEQRARCLYHVLAINSTNELARRGLKILGIVVTDSRPVKIPRDSQPIQIPKPTPASQPTFPSVAHVEQATPAEERRPFRIDPQTIVAELPFTPVRQPFASTPDPAPQPTGDSQPVAPVQTTAAATPLDTKPLPDAPQPVAAPQAEPARPPSQPVPVDQPALVVPNGSSLQLTPEQRSNPAAGSSAPQPVAGSGEAAVPAELTPANPTPQSVEQNQAPQYQADQFRPPSEPVPVAQSYYPQHPAGGLISRQETRPTQPLPAPQANVTQVLPQQGYPVAGHADATMGMPTPYGPAQPFSPAYPAVHSNPTLGLPPGQYNPQSQPLPTIHSNSTMAMPLYPQPQFQPAMAYNPAVHSSATMAMPMYDPMAILSAPLNRDYRTANPPRNGSKRRKQQPELEEDEGDEINILAVIIFGSLSITALGGLGMLILLMFTAS